MLLYIMLLGVDGWIAARKLQIAMEKRTFDRKVFYVSVLFFDLFVHVAPAGAPA
jgi:hypothetical protein